jgi:predicted XRE-type DNA-binding protein
MTKKIPVAAPDAVMHITPADGSVFEDLGFSKDDAKELRAEVINELDQRNKIKRVMVNGVKAEIARRGLTMVEAAKVLEISRPRLSDITHFKVEKFSIDAVADLMARLGRSVRVVIDDVPNASSRKRAAPD